MAQGCDGTFTCTLSLIYLFQITTMTLTPLMRRWNFCLYAIVSFSSMNVGLRLLN